MDNDGILSRQELNVGFRKIFGVVVESEVDEIIALADLNGNGELDFSEWLIATQKRQEFLSSQKLY